MNGDQLPESVPRDARDNSEVDVHCRLGSRLTAG